jgi:hypothetical protein
MGLAIMMSIRTATRMVENNQVFTIHRLHQLNIAIHQGQSSPQDQLFPTTNFLPTNSKQQKNQQ